MLARASRISCSLAAFDMLGVCVVGFGVMWDVIDGRSSTQRGPAYMYSTLCEGALQPLSLCARTPSGGNVHEVWRSPAGLYTSNPVIPKRVNVGHRTSLFRLPSVYTSSQACGRPIVRCQDDARTCISIS